MGKRVQRFRTDVSEPQMVQAIISAWRELFGLLPDKNQVALVLAQNNLETGNRKSMWNYNVGNITTDGHGRYDFYDDLTTNEQVQPGQWKKMNLKFRSYPSLQEGTVDYLKLLSGPHYAKAWQHIINPNPIAFSKALKSGGYYTANEPPYTKALTRLFNQSSNSNSYELAMSGRVHPANTPHPTNSPTNEIANLEEILDKYVNMLSAASPETSLKRLYKKTLPNHNILIKIMAPDHTSAVEFSRVLCTALDEDLLSTSYPHTDSHEVEVECSIAGPAQECFAAVQQMSEAMAETFKEATYKVNGILVKVDCIMNKKSSYQPISLNAANTNYRKFLLKFI